MRPMMAAFLECAFRLEKSAFAVSRTSFAPQQTATFRPLISLNRVGRMSEFFENRLARFDFLVSKIGDPGRKWSLGERSKRL